MIILLIVSIFIPIKKEFVLKFYGINISKKIINTHSTTVIKFILSLYNHILKIIIKFHRSLLILIY